MEGALTTAWNGTKADISAGERVWKCRLIHDCEWFSYRDRGCLLLCRAVISFCPTLSPMSAYITAEQMNSLSAELVLVIQPFY